jgi:ABC-type bacteriocin/lantibiotic exporter with double-glycine peptidase domain
MNTDTAGLFAPLDLFTAAGAAAASSAAPLDDCCRLLAAHLGISPAQPSTSSGQPVAAADAAAQRLEQYGLRGRPVRLGADWRRDGLHPLLGFWKDGAPVVLLPGGRRGYRLVDPEFGEFSDWDDATAADLAPWAFEVTVPLPAGRLRDVLGHARRRGDLRYLITAGIAAALLGGLLPTTGSLALTAVLGHRSGVIRELAVLSGFGLVVYAGLVLLRNLAVARVESYAEAVLGPAILDRLLRARSWRLGEYSAGDLVVRLAGVDTIRRMLGTVTLSAALNLVFGVTSLVVLAVLEPLASIPAVGAVLLAVLLVIRFGRRQLRHDRQVFDAYGRASGTLLEIIRGLDKIRVAGREEHAFRRWLGVFAEQKRADLRAAGWQSATAGLLGTLPAVLYALLLEGPHLLGGSLGPGRLLAVNIALSQFVMAVAQAGTLGTAVYGAVPVVDRILEVVRLEQEPSGAVPDPPGTVSLHGVTVRAPDGAELLHEVNLTAGAGELVGVVGPSGAGKSTLVRAMLGLAPCAQGEVRFDGRELEGLDAVAVRRSLAAVLQDASTAGGDIRATVAGGRPAVDDAEIWRALAIVGLAQEVRAMPMGLFTPVGTGSRMVSGGQRQRMLMARALAGHPRLLVLDEATSGLDGPTEKALLDRVAATGVTRVVVTHRVETLRAADRIVVLDAGRVVATGDFATLQAGCSVFATLVHAARPAAEPAPQPLADDPGSGAHRPATVPVPVATPPGGTA